MFRDQTYKETLRKLVSQFLVIQGLDQYYQNRLILDTKMINNWAKYRS